MLKCEGYKMFKGTAMIVPKSGDPFELTGTWLYKPEYKCWYVNGRSFGEAIVQDIREEKDDLVEDLKARIDALRALVVCSDNDVFVQEAVNGLASYVRGL